MGSTWIHRLLKKDNKTLEGICENCGPVKLKNNAGILKCTISRGYSQGRQQYRRKYFKNLEIYKCEKCGLEDSNFVFFDMNHKDANHKNNKRENLELLCPNCHRKESIIIWTKVDYYLNV